MSEHEPHPPSSGPLSSQPSRDAEAELFRTRSPERTGFPMTAWLIAGLVVLVVLGGIVVATHRVPRASPHAVQAVDPYGASLALSGIQMSESASLSAVKVTYLDGHVRNLGSRTVTEATVQVLFGNDEQLPAEIETVPLTMIRTREPYIDTEPLSAAPLRPGEDREFRLIFENIGTNWNQQIPQIRIVEVK